MSSFIIEVWIYGYSHGSTVVGAAGPVVGVDVDGRIDLQPTPATAAALFSTREGVLYVMCVKPKEAVNMGGARVPYGWVEVRQGFPVQVGLAIVTAREDSGSTTYESWSAARERASTAPSGAMSAASSCAPRATTSSVTASTPASASLPPGAPAKPRAPRRAWALAALALASLLATAVTVGARRHAATRGEHVTTTATAASPSTAAATAAALAPHAAPSGAGTPVVHPVPADEGLAAKGLAVKGSTAIAPVVAVPAPGKKGHARATAAPLTPELATERAVAEAIFTGDYEGALRAGEALVRTHPETPRYAVMVRVLRAKARAHSAATASAGPRG